MPHAERKDEMHALLGFLLTL